MYVKRVRVRARARVHIHYVPFLSSVSFLSSIAEYADSVEENSI